MDVSVNDETTNIFEVGKCYRIKIKNENANAKDLFVDAVYKEYKIWNVPDDEQDLENPVRKARELEGLKPSQENLVYKAREPSQDDYDDFSTYSLRIFPNDKNTIYNIIKFGTKLFVFDRLPPFDPWADRNGKKVLFDNYTYFYRSRKTRSDRSNIVNIPFESFEYLDFQEKM